MTKIIICPPIIERIASMDMPIIAWAIAEVRKNGEVVHRFIDVDEITWTVADAEREARKDPNAEWIIEVLGGLQGKTYKRMAECQWELIAHNNGVA